MRREVLISFISVLISIKANALFIVGAYNDTSIIYLADSIQIDLEFNESIESNLELNLDSLVNLRYVKNQPDNLNIDTIDADSTVPDYPDSVYIERLAAIPTIVDLSYNRIVKNYIDVYAKKRRNTVEVMLGLSKYYFPIFDDIFDYYNIPNEMKYMSIIESALNPRAYSRARAVGLWQFMYGTGRVYGLEINSLIDERRDPIKSTHAAAKFVSDLYGIYNDWTLVIAAYNCGPGNVNKAIRRAGGKTNYWDIYYYLPRETRGHVPAFIAAIYIMNYYDQHNLKPAALDLSLFTDTVWVKKKLHFKQLEEVLGIPIKQLQDLNPQYLHDIIPADKNHYSLCLPVQYTGAFIDMEDSIYAYKDSVFFDPNKIIISPTSRNYASTTPLPPGNDYVKIEYTVKSGDNLGYISEWYNVRISDLRYWNNIRQNLIRAGQELTIYKHKSKASKYEKINSMTFTEKQAMIGKPVTNTENKTITREDYSGEYVMYTVKSGDNLWDIAKKYPGVSNTDIMRLNNISDPDKIKPGQKLKIKPKN
ncbi:MAG: LysM peptidoglycan-binding domain-containing protein [Bacteroidales bacterium]|nr:LysM peptidoglycan-binding domain-containing protein [Bacteroidales bacterium]